MTYRPQRALELLRLGAGSAAVFRDGQEEAIRHLVEGKGRLLVVQKTGWGKSFVYFIATQLLRESGAGPTLLVSPLLSLMRNQIAAASRTGVRAATINSDNQEEWSAVESAIVRDDVDILLISPERLANERFRSQVLAAIGSTIGLLVIDEAHCISDWGHDFRPHYRLIERIIRTLPSNLRLLATTATANQRVIDDLADTLGPNMAISRGDLSRPSLKLQTLRLPGQAERLAWLADQIPQMPGSGIIYTLTVRDAELVAAWLRHRGIVAEAYTGEAGERRPMLEEALLSNRVKALVATSALGMGFDKPDLAFVVHYQTPGSVVAYYQQVGRAGRALQKAYAILLAGKEDTEIGDFFIESAFPTREEVEQVLGALLDSPGGLSVPELMGKVNVSKGRIDKAIALLSLEASAPIAKIDGKWELTATTLGSEFWARAERLTRLRREEQLQMQHYVDRRDGHMAFLVSELNGEMRESEEPDLPLLPTTPPAELVEEALRFLRRTDLEIEARALWPAGGMPSYGVGGRIEPRLRPENGRALCYWGDAAWGELVRVGKYRDGRFSDELVRACAELVKRWNPSPAPAWVTCVPSLRHTGLVPDFAERLAAALEIPFRVAFARTTERPQQKTMANSVQQARNVDGVFRLLEEEDLPRQPVLLVDDIVDSRWTITVAAWLLRSHGCGEVRALALAMTARG